MCFRCRIKKGDSWMKYLLAVDGGGTKTEFTISNSDGANLETFCVGATNYKAVGTQRAQENFKQGVDWIRSTMHIEMKEISYAVCGMSGCDSDNDTKIIKKMIHNAGLNCEEIYIYNDGVLAYFAQALEPGLVIISGTGSIVIGINREGEILRTGGWGYNISDIGSGYWIGNEAIKYTLLYCDGCREFSELYKVIKDYFDVDGFESLPEVITQGLNCKNIAEIAKFVVELAEKENIVAQEILKEGASTLADLAYSAYSKLELNKEASINIVLSGGVLKNQWYKNLLEDYLKNKINTSVIVTQLQVNSPSYGGIQLAKRLARGKENE